jgi:hypothetical protein
MISIIRNDIKGLIPPAGHSPDIDEDRMGGQDAEAPHGAHLYRETAKSLRARAASLRTAEARDELLSLGADYQRLADHVQSSLPHRLPENLEARRTKQFSQLRLCSQLCTYSSTFPTALKLAPHRPPPGAGCRCSRHSPWPVQ